MNNNELAIQMMQDGKYEDAAKLFNEYIEQNPNDAVGYTNFGNLLMHIRNLDKAAVFFQKAIDLDDKAATAHYGLGNAFYEQGEYEQARHHFQTAIDLGLDVADVYYMLGMILKQKEQNKLALPYFLRAVEIDSADEEILFQYGLTLAQNNLLDDAEKTFKDLLALNDQHSDAHYNLGIIELFHDHANEALHHFNQALKAQPDHLLAANGKEKVETLLHDQNGQ